MEKNFVVTIGRQFGSGGREIGIKLAKILNIAFYDKKLISEAAKRSGLNSEIFEQKDERSPNTLFYALAMNFGFPSGTGFSPESLFTIQSDTISDISSRESCLIVGRCADYILRENKRCVNIFILAPLEDRVRRVMARKGIGRKEAEDMIVKVDKSRQAYYDFYTEKKWGSAASYNLSIDSSLLGDEKTAEYIGEFVKRALADME